MILLLAIIVVILSFRYIFEEFIWLITMHFISSIFLLVVESWNTQHHGQNIHPTEKFNSINLFKILCVVTWSQLFLTSMFMEAVRGQNPYRDATLWHFNSTFGSPTVPVLFTLRIENQFKFSPIHEISLHIFNFRNKPAQLDF